MNDPAAARTIAAALTAATGILMGHSGAPRLDAQLILAHLLSTTREHLIAHDEASLSPEQAAAYAKLVGLRARGMPTAYIVGKRTFFDREFTVTSHVLIPRPETELIVEKALGWVQAQGRQSDPLLRVVDVGTGSGVIALSLAAHLPAARVLATDLSAAALQVAQHNGRDLRNVRFMQGDLLAGIGGQFDVMCANLPYIATAELDVLEVAKFEPAIALDGGKDGLALVRRLLQQAPSRLAKPSILLLEIGADQGEAALAAAHEAFPHGAQISLHQDHAALDRVLEVLL
ncbi:MAG: peptide chain release factor N(5)-glutamine methyltransferase [Chloroflexi bacterium CFX4]|nr:peptide chain release factor N(5)-glutamine methyltransferase [Chloroflexi bacterium CFX4]MDL1924107.1 peptide chain release factor N(5)-glutamine methyltransferase [Chloroflexi bacterium CFX3]